MKIYHQVGHNSNWNMESHGDDGAGDGLILAPRYMRREKIEALGITLKNRSYFDPQWFLPDTQRGNWKSIHFFQMCIVTVLIQQIMWGLMRINVPVIAWTFKGTTNLRV